MAYQNRYQKGSKFKIEPEIEAALILAPIAIAAGMVGFFIDGDVAIIPFIVRFIIYITAGYLAASRFHKRSGFKPNRRVFDQMPLTGLRGGLYAALLAWLVLVIFLVIAEFADINTETGILGGLLSALLDAIAGLLLGVFGGWAYSKLNRPKYLR